MKKTKTKPFRVAVSGKTVDGRQIPAQDIIEMAETYNTELYQARINLEHLLSIYPESTFKAYGDVIAVEAREEEIAGEQVMSLYATLEVIEDLEAINQSHQKIFTSIEYMPNFRGSDKAYLTGLALTDTPASVGTEALKFVVANEATINYSASIETEKLTAAEEPEQPEEGAKRGGFFNLKNIFNRNDLQLNALEDETRAGFKSVERLFEEVADEITQLTEETRKLSDQLAQQQEAINTLNQLANTPANDDGDGDDHCITEESYYKAEY